MKRLTARHKRAIELLKTGLSIEETANTVGVTRKTIYNWLDDPLFNDELQTRESEFIRRLNNKLININEKALDKLDESLDSEDENIRVRCINIAVGKFHKTIEIEDILQRLDAIEAARAKNE